MNGTLRGLPTLNDLRPLRNSAPAPVPPPTPTPTQTPQAQRALDLIDSSSSNEHDRPKSAPAGNEEEMLIRHSPSAPVDMVLAKEREKEKEIKKPHLAISELVQSPSGSDNTQVQLPSFVSLSVVEKSPTQAQLNLNNEYPSKRPRLDAESDLSLDPGRLLPRPVQKDEKQVIPLLPAMVTGLHEPPPSAALLPSMDLDARPGLQRSSTSKMQVRDMLLKTDKFSNSRPPEQMLNTPEVTAAELPRSMTLDAEGQSTDIDTPSTTASVTPAVQAPKKDQKVRRTRRKWTEAESQDLLAGVKKHGFGKWKQILGDSSYNFVDRTSIDLKDRFRVFAKDYAEIQTDPGNSDDAHAENSEAGLNADSRTYVGGNGPINKQRRKRHPWTREEDAALLLGVQRYGFQWTDIHNDKDLGLGHRRATDLRDRIRNLYPEGYKHAEARPLRAEVKKAERAGKKETPAGTLYAPPGQMDSITFSANTTSPGTTATTPRNTPRRQTTTGKAPSIASLTRNPEDDDLASAPRPAPRRSKTIAEPPDHSGITLPSLALDAAHGMDDWDNTLPPFMHWEQDI